MPAPQAKGHHFLADTVAWPLPLRRVNGLLVLSSRMNWPVGGRDTLSPVLAERITDASENEAFHSFWTLFQAVPLRRLCVEGGHRGGSWLGILGSRWKAIELNPWHRRPGSAKVHSGRLSQVCAAGRAPGGGICLCTKCRSQGRVLETSQAPPVFQPGDCVAPGNMWASQLEGELLASRGWKPGIGLNPP